MLFPILTITGGVLAASSLIIARKPDAKQVFDKIAPYQGFLGVGLVAVGVWGIVRLLPHLDALMSAPLTLGITIAAIALDLAIGFLLGYGLFNRWFLSKNAAAQAKGSELLAKIARIQAPLGCAAALVGVALLIGI